MSIEKCSDKQTIEYNIKELQKAIEIIKKGSFNKVYVNFGSIIIEVDANDAMEILEDKIRMLKAFLSKL